MLRQKIRGKGLEAKHHQYFKRRQHKCHNFLLHRSVYSRNPHLADLIHLYL